ncbi:uncharacterized protein LOC143021684 [Oratosquilla oratoria]|uniref:uncharacterized protein LOC143021684 n=1 Tax=Oratosquilla oratoria TaxID=337810 RepID=UPI003F76B3B4
MMHVLRSVLGGCVVVVACMVVLTTLTASNQGGPAIHSLVTHTHHHINQLHNLKEELEGRLVHDEKYLQPLGFTNEPRLYPQDVWNNVSLPIIVSAVNWEEASLAEGLVRNLQQLLLNASIILYALDSSIETSDKLNTFCKAPSCFVLEFNFSTYPAHVRDLRLKAYRPIIIQEMLNRAGAVLWLDADVRISAPDNTPSLSPAIVDEWASHAFHGGGLVTWPFVGPISLPTAALTHPNMFEYFHADKHNYDFHQMGDAGTVLLFNTGDVHQHLMLPWVQCALTSNCISPIGAQATGCRYNKKPLFRYSGCHRYDTSAFNVVLGVMFHYDTRPYLQHISLFTRVSLEDLEEHQPSAAFSSGINMSLLHQENGNAQNNRL